jgi:tight adherence protein B
MPSEVASALVAALCAIGVVLLLSGARRLRRRLTTTRRIGTLLAEAPLAQAPVEPNSLAARVRGQLQRIGPLIAWAARLTELRVPALGLALVSMLLAVATLSVPWALLAVAMAMLGHALGARARRQRRVESQAVATLQLLSSGLRAGYSVSQALGLVARRSPEPTASEFTLLSQEIDLGVDLDDGLRHLAARTANADYQLVSIIIGVQHDVGGNLAQILDLVGVTVRERFELRREVSALTAQQRMSSIVLTVLPFGLLLFLFVTDRSFVDPLFKDPIGQGLLVVAGAMIMVGWVVMRSIGRVDV